MSRNGERQRIENVFHGRKTVKLEH